MKVTVLSWLLGLLALLFPFTQGSRSHIARSDSLTTQVQWDKYSLIVNDKRIVLWSGEVHTWRLPVPDLWPDICQKAKAAGLNALSFYTHWGLVNPSDGTLDFDGYRALQPFFDAAKESGLYLIARPGPYINAETTAGGIPGWVTNIEGELRTNASDFVAAYTPYWRAVGKMFADNQVSNGGPIIAVQIENEYYLNWAGDIDRTYISDLENQMREVGVDVPFTFNDASPEGRLLNGTGAVQLYGADAYPLGFSCSSPDSWYTVDTQWTATDFFATTSGEYDEPYFIPEYQMGAFVGWNQTGSSGCRQLTGANFERVFYLNSLAMNIKMINFYMFFGGTNFGQMMYPSAITSYDYAAPVEETRALVPHKYGEFKSLGLWLRYATDFPQTVPVGNGSAGYVDNAGVYVDEFRNVVNNAGFYIGRQTNSSSFDTQTFKLSLNTSLGSFTVPSLGGNITFAGRDSRVFMTDFSFGTKQTLLYNTAPVMLGTTIGSQDVLVLYGELGQTFEIALLGTGGQMKTLSGSANVNITTATESDKIILNWNSISAGISTFKVTFAEGSVLVLFADTLTSYQLWNPTITDSSEPFGAYAGYGSTESVLVGGPYFVRDVGLEDKDSIIALRGDLNDTASLWVLGPSHAKGVSWNGVLTKAKKNAFGAWSVDLPGPASIGSVVTPQLGEWRFIDALPEIEKGFDDSAWTKADHVTTLNPNKPYDGKYVLYSQDYGFMQGNVIYRGHFKATGKEDKVNISLSTGPSGAGSVWLNEAFLGSAYVESTAGIEDVNATFTIPQDALKVGKDNVLTILTDHMGFDQTDQTIVNGGTPNDIKFPRGIRGYSFSTDLEWKIQGNYGGNTHFPDRVRGILNEGGLCAERAGYHLPGFDDSKWVKRSPSEGLTKPGVGFFRTEFELHVPKGLEAPVSFVYPDTTGNYRSQLYVNGWMFGKRVGALGPQVVFPVPPGIINTNGHNTIALSLWALDNTTDAKVIDGFSVELLDGTWTTSRDDIVSNNPGWTKRKASC